MSCNEAGEAPIPFRSRIEIAAGLTGKIVMILQHYASFQPQSRGRALTLRPVRQQMTRPQD
jgi:hypothetical protein